MTRALTIDVPWGEPNDMVWSQDTKLLACATDEGAVHVLDTATGEQVAALGDHDVDEVTAVDFAPGGAVIASADLSSTVYLWSARSGSPLSSLTHDHGGHFLAYLADGKTLLTAGLGETAGLIDVESMKVTAVLRSSSGEFRLTATSEDRSIFAAFSAHDKVLLWDLRTREVRPSLRGSELIHVTCIAVSPDAKELAAGHEDGMMTVWSLDTLTLRSRFSAHDGAVRFIAYSPDASAIASSGADHLVRLWSTQDLKPLGYKTTPGSPGLVAWAPGGLTLAADTGAGKVELWDRSEAGFARVRGD